MSIIEWMAEGFNPGPAGGMGFGGNGRGDRPRATVFLCFAIAVALIAGAVFGLIAWQPDQWREMLPLFLIGFGLYVLAAYLVRPEPNMDNIGWLGGLMDNPFRISDNVNRILLFLQLVLLPGRFVAASLVDMAVLARHGFG